jgi:endonuclease/exonuclease/phosphatase family metal-dependent hydrolase
VQPLAVEPWIGAPGGGIAPMVIGVDRVPPTTAINDDFGPGGGNVETAGDFDPVNEGIDFWESLEGMLVRVNAPTAVSPTIANGSAQEIWVTAAGAPATGTTERGGIGISPGDFNPERIQLDDMINADVMPTVDVGARLGDVTGVVNYDFASYEVLLRTMPVVTAASTLDREVTTLAPGADLLRVATFNVENLHPGSGADKFTSLAQAIVRNLRTPQIINLEEVQDNSGPTNNGVVDASVTLQMLVDAIVAAGGPEYEWRQIDPVNNQDGGQLGGNIRVAFLFDPAQGVSFVDGSLTRLTDSGGAFDSSRKPLVGTFTYNGESVTLVGNHFNSKGGDAPLYGTTQPPVLVTEMQRLQQANVVKAYVQGLLASDPDANVIVLGDLNDFEFSAPLTVLEGASLTSLIETLPADQRYTYNFEGNAQALDHIMATPNLMTLLRGYDVVHINSEFTVQVSDHDPVVARFLVERDGATIDGTPGRDALVGTAGADVITGRGGRDTLTGGGSGDRFVYTSLLDASDVITDFELGRDRLVIDALLGSVGYTGSTPVADGYLSITTTGGHTQVLFDADGSAGGGAARALVELTGVTAPSAGVLLDPTAFGA